MAKTKTAYFCQNCGAQSSKWVGKCPSCGEWNTFVEEVMDTGHEKKGWEMIATNKKLAAKPQTLSEISITQDHRLAIPDKELHRVLGGGLVYGSLVLMGGEPGIGKSTLLLQLALKLKDKVVLYVSGEESEQQIKMRAERLGLKSEQLLVLTETSLQNIFSHIKKLTPDVLIIDSIQTVHTDVIESSPGSVSQIRECASELLRYAKQTSTPVFLIGHITKDGLLAGPKVLEHMVDTVLQFEGDASCV